MFGRRILLMNNVYLHKNNPAKELGNLKSEQERLRWKRGELMTRLREAGFGLDEIGEIYGCSRQYVEQTIKEHQAQKGAAA